MKTLIRLMWIKISIVTKPRTWIINKKNPLNCFFFFLTWEWSIFGFLLGFWLNWSWKLIMAWNPLKEVAHSKPLFLTVYTAVIIGILVSSFYVFSSVFSSSGSFSSSWLSSSTAYRDLGMTFFFKAGYWKVDNVIGF